MSINFKCCLLSSVLFFLFLYCSLYILRDLYFSIQNFQIKKYINKILPFLTRYNRLLLILSLIFSTFYFYNSYTSKLFFFVIIIPLILSLIFTYIPIIKLKYSKYLRLLSYILLISMFFITVGQNIILWQTKITVK